MSETSPGKEQLLAILSKAIAGGADSVTMEYDSGHALEVCFNIGNSGAGFALDRGPGGELRDAVYEEKKKGRGKMRVSVNGKSYLVQIKTYESFGEMAYRLTFREAKR